LTASSGFFRLAFGLNAVQVEGRGVKQWGMWGGGGGSLFWQRLPTACFNLCRGGCTLPPPPPSNLTHCHVIGENCPRKMKLDCKTTTTTNPTSVVTSFPSSHPKTRLVCRDENWLARNILGWAGGGRGGGAAERAHSPHPPWTQALARSPSLPPTAISCRCASRYTPSHSAPCFYIEKKKQQ
jgi:hypothetical protein